MCLYLTAAGAALAALALLLILLLERAPLRDDLE